MPDARFQRYRPLDSTSGSSVLLAPDIDLHTGFHGALVGSPPAGIEFTSSGATHSFVFPDAGRSPHECFHLGEFIEVGQADGVVQTPRWPVLGARAWIADTDDLAYPILCGRHILDAGFRATFRSAWDDAFAARLRARVENMVAAYRHPSCVAVLLWGQPAYAKASATALFEALDVAEPGRRFLEKVTVLRPAPVPGPESAVAEKWRGEGALRVLFCGREFDSKNGALALRIMARARVRRPAIEFVYVGNIPREVQVNEPVLLDGVEHFESLPHDAVLQLMNGCHVLFHPSKYESVGMVYLEAAAAGMAIVTATGPEMDYVGELFASGGAGLLDRDGLGTADEEAAFETLLVALLDARDRLRTMAQRNYRLTTVGEYSQARRNEILADVYREAAARRSAPLGLDDLPHRVPDGVRRMSSAEVKRDELDYRRRHGVGELRFVV